MEHTMALRAQWFAQLSEAIEGAQRLAWQLGTYDRTSAQARELYGRLEAARTELESLRGMADAARVRELPDCGWLDRLGWSTPFADPPL